MWRTIVALIGLVSFATLLAEGVAVAFLAARGHLNAETVAAVEAALSGQTLAPVELAAPAPPPVPPSADEVEAARTVALLDLNARADELRLLKDLLDKQAEQLKKDRTAYEDASKAFEARLAEVGARTTDEATEQAQLVIKAMKPRDAVVYLQALPEADAIRVVKGLPERTVANILKELAAGTDEEREHGRTVFEAIVAGRPESELVEAARAALPAPAKGDAAP